MELLLDGFVRRVLGKWQSLKVSHSLVGVLFTRIFYVEEGQFEDATALPSGDETDEEDNVFPGWQLFRNTYHFGGKEMKSSSVLMEDFYDNAVDSETHVDWLTLVMRFKTRLLAFLDRVFHAATARAAQLSREAGEGKRILPLITTSQNSNILEAINLSLSVCEKHYVDRDLSRMGQDIVLLSPGCGVYEVKRRHSNGVFVGLYFH